MRRASLIIFSGIIFCLMALSAICHAYWAADGRGIFKVVVEVHEFEMKDGKPTGILSVEGATVSLSDAGADEVSEDPSLKSRAALFRPVLTNPAGDAIAYYYAGWSSTSESNGQTHGVRGVLKVSKKGYEDYECDLRKLLGNSLKSDEHSTPTVTAILQKTK